MFVFLAFFGLGPFSVGGCDLPPNPDSKHCTYMDNLVRLRVKELSPHLEGGKACLHKRTYKERTSIFHYNMTPMRMDVDYSPGRDSIDAPGNPETYMVSYLLALKAWRIGHFLRLPQEPYRRFLHAFVTGCSCDRFRRGFWLRRLMARRSRSNSPLESAAVVGGWLKLKSNDETEKP